MHPPSSPATSVQQGLQDRAHAANSCTTREPQIANETPDPGDQAFVSRSILASPRFFFTFQILLFLVHFLLNRRYVPTFSFSSFDDFSFNTFVNLCLLASSLTFNLVFCLVVAISLSGSSSWNCSWGKKGERRGKTNRNYALVAQLKLTK